MKIGPAAAALVGLAVLTASGAGILVSTTTPVLACPAGSKFWAWGKKGDCFVIGQGRKIAASCALMPANSACSGRVHKDKNQPGRRWCCPG